MVAAASRAIMSPRLQSHLGGDVEKLVGVVWFSRISSGYGDLRISRSFIDGYSFFFASGTDVVNVRPAQGGAAPAACRRHSLEVEDEGYLKNFVGIFVCVEVLCNVRCFFNASVLFGKKLNIYFMNETRTIM